MRSLDAGRRVLLPATLAALLAGVLPAWAALSLSMDSRSLFFGLMELGERKELAQSGAYHNQLTCASTNGRAWYLKAQLLTPLSAGAEAMPVEALQWQLTRTTGIGTVAHPHQWQPFSLQPDLVYLGSADEAAGQSVQIELKYLLTVPELQVSGAYQATIRFTLTEAL